MAKKTKHHLDFWVLLEVLYSLQKRDWNLNSTLHKPSRDAQATHRDLRACFGYQIVDEDIIKECKENSNSPVDFQDKRWVMFLPPMKRDAAFVPVMSVKYEPDAKFHKSCLRLRVFLIRREKEGKSSFVGVGFRIESPEKHCQANNGAQEEGEVGAHDFYHAQLMTKFECGSEIVTPQWLPCHQPSFPLWALDPIQAICNLILTLYGGRYYKEFLLDAFRGPKKNIFSEEFKKANDIYFSQ